MAMSFYPNEGEPLWSKYSTEAVMHTMEVYSKYSFDYPYPTAQSVNGPVGGMEYPMITFNGPRTELEDDGSRTYSRSEKEFLIGVVIHEIGHIYFPMIVNSDERQWTWMDEGLNTFLQYLAEQEWDINYRSDRGEPRWITDYMSSSYQVPMMTNSESLLQFGNNAYAKPATALVVLRETILGRELFDQAFREYSQRWKFKRPTPYDFFRTMEEASGVDLDWFPFQVNLAYQVPRNKKADYIGKEALEKQRAMIDEGTPPFKMRMVGITLGGKEITDYAPDFWLIADMDGNDVGYVTSPWWSPELGTNIALAWVPWTSSEIGTKYQVRLPDEFSESPGVPVGAEIVDVPFRESVNPNKREVQSAKGLDFAD